MKIAIICAMEKELQSFLKNNHYEKKIVKGMVYNYLEYKGHEIYLTKSDIGKVNAACLTTFTILAIKPRIIINAGVGGGISPSIKPYDTVTATKVTYHDSDFMQEEFVKGTVYDHGMLKISKSLLDKMPNDFIKGLIVSGDVFVNEPERIDINKRFPKALSVDMESCPIVHAASLLRKKVVVIRTISDNTSYDDYWNNVYKACDLVSKKTFEFIDNL